MISNGSDFFIAKLKQVNETQQCHTVLLEKLNDYKVNYLLFCNQDCLISLLNEEWDNFLSAIRFRIHGMNSKFLKKGVGQTNNPDLRFFFLI